MRFRMKKVLSGLVSIMMIANCSSLVVGCARNGTAHNGGDNPEKKYTNSYNYQYGCDTQNDPKGIDNESFHMFFGSTDFDYSTYTATSDGGHDFFGDFPSMLNCGSKDDQNLHLTGWEGEQVTTQLILVDKISAPIHDLKVSIQDLNPSQTLISPRANFLTFIKVQSDKNHIDSALVKNQQYVPDAIGESTLDNLDFNVQPIWIVFKVDWQAHPGNYHYLVNLSWSVTELNGKVTNHQATTPISLKVVDRFLGIDDSRNDPEKQFGFSANAYFANSMKFVDDGEYKNYDEMVGDQLGPIPGYMPNYLTPQLKPYFESQLQSLRDVDDSFLYGTGMSKQLIQWSGQLLDEPNWNQQQYLALLKQPLSTILSHKWKWTFNFDALDEYLKEAAKFNFTQVNLTTINTSLYNPSTFTFWYLMGSNQSKGPQVDVKMRTSDANANPGPDFNEYMKVHSQLIKALSEHLHNILQSPEYMTGFGMREIAVAENFDEVADTFAEAVQKNIQQNDKYHLIKSNYFAGWHFKYNPFDEDQVKNIFLNKYSQMILQQREIVSQFDNSNIYKLRSNILRRQGQGNSTYIYSSWNNFPGGYMQSDISEMIWEMLMAYKTGSNGYVRWSYDFYISDYYKKRAVDRSDGDFEAGDNALVYPGDINGPRLSVRYYGYLHGLEIVRKMQYLISNHIGDKFKINSALNSIGFANNTVRNNIYKWYPDDFNLQNLKFKIPPLNNNLTLGEQIYKVDQYINSL